MAKEHNQLDYAVRLQRGVRIISGLGFESDGVTRLSENLQTCLNPWERADWSRLIGDRVVIGQQTQTAVVGEFPAVGLRNPTGSSAIVLVLRHVLLGSQGTASAFALRSRAQSATSVTTTGSPFSRDSRDGFAGNGGQARILTASAAVAANIGNGPLFFAAGTNEQGTPFDLPIVISPGFEIFWQREATNTPCRAGFVWVESRILPGEQAAP